MRKGRMLLAWIRVLVGGAVAIGALALLVACQPGVPAPAATPTPSPPATSTAENRGSKPGRPSEEVEAYRRVVDQTFSQIGQLTRLLSRVGIQLNSAPDMAPESAEILRLTQEAFESTREDLNRQTPPEGYGELHQQLLDALALYAQAAEALVPSPETGVGDYSRFQDLMLQAGKNAHGAGATLEELNAPS